jgi:hypothetical protein
MDEPRWTKLKDGIVIKAKPENSFWQEAYGFVRGPGILKIVADGQWYYSTNFAGECSANGDLLSPFDSSRCIHQKAPVGSLIGKIGGSIADKDSSAVFVVGSSCIRNLDGNTAGPLFLAINDMLTGLGDNEGHLIVNIFFAPA